MAVKKEEVLAKAKELGVTLSDDQVNAYVLIGALPSKENSGTPPGGNGGDGDGDGDDDDDLTAGMKERLRKEKEKRNALKAQMDKQATDLKKLQDAEAARQAEKDKEKGNWEKLNKDAEAAKAKAEATAAKARDKFKETAIRTTIESKLLEAGVPAARLSKAVKLFDSSNVEFSWTNEEALEHEVEIPESEIEAFKKDNDFLFDESGGDEKPSGYQGNRPPKGGSKTSSEKKREELKSLFSALR